MVQKYYMSFEDYLLGHWSNKYQAQSHPTHYATVELEWRKIPGGYHSKNYYRHQGPDNPYREKYHRMVKISETRIRVQNYNIDWTRTENCDMIFTFDGTSWKGELESPGKCMGVKGYRVESLIYLFGDKLHSRDRGFDPSGKRVWGSNLLYKFTRMGE